MIVSDKDIMRVNKKLGQLKSENAEMKEKLKDYIPRRRVRRIFKSLKSILEADIENDDKIYINKLKKFIQKIEKEGPQIADQDIKQAIEHIIGNYEIQEKSLDNIDD